MNYGMISEVAAQVRAGGRLPLFRVGDFYEAFDRDAEVLNYHLDVPMSSIQFADLDRRIARAGIPYHSVDAYIAKLNAVDIDVVRFEDDTLGGLA